MSFFKASKTVFEGKISEFEGLVEGNFYYSNRRIRIEVSIGHKDVGSNFKVSVLDRMQHRETYETEDDSVREEQIFYQRKVFDGAQKAVTELYAAEDLHAAKLITWLVHEDLRGQAAEEAAWDVFYTLVVSHPLRGDGKSLLKTYSPKWYVMLVEMREQWKNKFYQR